MAAAAWQCVAAAEALRRGLQKRANISVVGCNQQAIGACLSLERIAALRAAAAPELRHASVPSWMPQYYRTRCGSESRDPRQLWHQLWVPALPVNCCRAHQLSSAVQHLKRSRLGAMVFPGASPGSIPPRQRPADDRKSPGFAASSQLRGDETCAGRNGLLDVKPKH